jgi:Tfp pilus assembly protein PilV
MIALLILAIGLIMALTVTRQSKQVVWAAEEMQAANHLEAHLMTRTVLSEGERVGQTERFIWKGRLDRIGGGRPLVLCRREALSTSIASGRAFRISTLVICPEAAGA